MRILFTGASGKAGRHVAPYLASRGHVVLNADLQPLGADGVDDLTVDLTDPGQTWGALTSYANFGELEPGTGRPTFDAVVHFAALARILIAPDCETFRVNTLSTYNVLEAATKLGIGKIIIASSETTYGICFADGEVKPDYVPIDEDHPTVPHDAYAMSKVANEICAKSFHARTGADIFALRLNNVIEPHEYAENFPSFMENPDLRRRNIFGYIDVRDLGQMVERCLATDGLGYQVLNVANADMSVNLTSDEVRARYYEGVPVQREMGAQETFYDISRARELVGFDPQHSWRDVLKP